jgi:hypothetical protein
MAQNIPLERWNLKVTIAEAVSFIVEALRDPQSPRWCAPGVMACFTVLRIYHKYGNHDLGDIVEQSHSFGSTMVAFLTAERSIADIESLDAVWAPCQCSQADIKSNNVVTEVHSLGSQIVADFRTRSHNLNDSRPYGRFGNKADIIASVFHNIVHFLCEGIERVKPFSIARGRHPEIWPAAPNDLIPFGMKNCNTDLIGF